ncbi:MAG: S8 family peptidase [Phycisphaerales bacterium]|nr:MAG: S8 family peptidase [Phycisphaerales bacterium]
MKKRFGRWLLCIPVLAAPGCSPPDAVGDGADSAISGRLIIPSGPIPSFVLEQELNDDLDQPQFVARLEAGDEITIFGDISAPAADGMDVFEFVAGEPLEVSCTLSFEASGDGVADLDLLLHDFVNFACAPEGGNDPLYAGCHETKDNPEVGSFAVTDAFAVVVRAANGAATYQLDIAASSSAPLRPRSAPSLNGARTRHAVHELERSSRVDTPVAAEAGAFVPGELLVVFQEDVPIEERSSILRAHRLRVVDESPSGVLRVRLANSDSVDGALLGEETKRLASELRVHQGVRIAECNFLGAVSRIPNDKFYNLQWHYTVINLPQAWDFTVGSDDIVVAVIDTGIVSAHPDLKDRLIGGYDFISDAKRARDGDGRDPDPEDPGDQAGGPGLSSFHGTHVAGTIGAATNNARGVAGVTWQAKVMLLRAFGVDGGTAFDAAEAIRYAAGLPNVSGSVPETPARVINLSFTRPTASVVEEEAIRAASGAGVLLVAAAGNDFSATPGYPAAVPEVISVSAVDGLLERALYSNFGPTIDLAAPGGFNGYDLDGDGLPDGVLSTGARDFTSGINLRYEIASGTSMAAPHVAGVAVLVMAANPLLSANEIRAILESTATDLGDEGRDDEFGFGRVDAAAAVREARRRAGITPESSPILSLSTESLDFGADRNELRVRVFNAGGGFLTVSSVVVEHVAGEGWLRAGTRGSTSADTNADEIVVTVFRSDQPDGVLRGFVRVVADEGQAADIDVIAIVGEVETLTEHLTVIAIDRATNDEIAAVDTDEGRDFEYTFTNLPAGDYAILAGTDHDDDGQICEFGDLCGAWPTFIEPGTVSVRPGSPSTGIDFAVSRRLLRQALNGP